MSESRKRYFSNGGCYSKETIEKIKIGNTGKKMSSQSIIKIKQARINFFKNGGKANVEKAHQIAWERNKGKPFTEERKRNISIGQKRRFLIKKIHQLLLKLNHHLLYQLPVK